MNSVILQALFQYLVKLFSRPGSKEFEALLIRPPTWNPWLLVYIGPTPAHEEASNFCLSENSFMKICQMKHFQKKHCRFWQIGCFHEISIAGVYNPGTSPKSALQFSTFALVEIHQNQRILHRSIDFRKSTLSVCNVDFLIQLILCKNSRKLAM